MLQQGKADEAATLAGQALEQFGGGDQAAELTTLRQQADAVVTASAEDVSVTAKPLTAQDVLREKLLGELQQGVQPGDVLTHLQQAVDKRPSLADHCVGIARALGRAAVEKYGPTKAQSYSRPVCDTSYAAGVASIG